MATCSALILLYFFSKNGTSLVNVRVSPKAALKEYKSQPPDKLPQPAQTPGPQSKQNLTGASTISCFLLEQNSGRPKRVCRKYGAALNDQQKARAIIDLLSFSPGEGLAPLPDKTKLLKAAFEPPVITIDLSRELTLGAVNFGARDEMLAIFCLTNTFLLNFPDFKSLQILVEGCKNKTLAGHIDISKPLYYQPDMD
ncbi:MAG: GerMN domain-containing protein [Deltaproteobacteria bacterium]|nr:GerMN domain-containing protein [Deltaproteobacteria bacterium]